MLACTGWAKKTRLFLRVDNFATVNGRKAYYMSKNSKLACQSFKYSLHNLHKSPLHVKLC